MFEVCVSGIDGERGAFKVDIDAVEAIVRDDAGDRGDVVWNAVWIGKREVLAAAAEGDHDFFALALQVGNVGFELRGVEPGRSLELHRSFGRVLIRCRKGNDDHVPLRRDLADGDSGTSP